MTQCMAIVWKAIVAWSVVMVKYILTHLQYANFFVQNYNTLASFFWDNHEAEQVMQ